MSSSPTPLRALLPVPLQLHVSPSTLWDGAWKQGVYDEHSPYEDSRLTVVMKSGRNLAPADVSM